MRTLSYSSGVFPIETQRKRIQLACPKSCSARGPLKVVALVCTMVRRPRSRARPIIRQGEGGTAGSPARKKAHLADANCAAFSITRSPIPAKYSLPAILFIRTYLAVQIAKARRLDVDEVGRRVSFSFLRYHCVRKRHQCRICFQLPSRRRSDV